MGVTVVIPNWNHRPFLPRSIKSARAGLAAIEALGFPGEVLVIDDCSRDGSVRELRSLSYFYGWSDVSTVFLNENVGLCRVRNLGLRLAKYRYALMLDADNEVLPEGVSALFRAAVETGAGFCYGNLLDEREGSVVGIRSNGVATSQLTLDNYIDALALINVEEALAVGGYIEDRNLQHWADWEFLLHLIAEELLIVFVPLILGRYHILPESMLTSSAERQKSDMNVMRRMYWQTGALGWNSRPLGRVYHPDIGYLDEGWEVGARGTN
jgi:glycosyltransferase involved in cell wall biosynthesis